MYIMTTPNLDATGHQWVGALGKFNFWLEYQKGQGNTVADMPSQITTHLGPEVVQSILDGATLGKVLHWLEAKKKTDLRTILGEHASSEEG